MNWLHKVQLSKLNIQIEREREETNYSISMGDFNAKVGNRKDGKSCVVKFWKRKKKLSETECKLNSQTVTKWQLWKQFVNCEAAVNEGKNMNFTL